MSLLAGMMAGFLAWFVVRYVVGGIYTVDQNERAIKTVFGRAQRLGTATVTDGELGAGFDADERARYAFPLLRVIPPGGPYFKMPWEKIYKVSVATETVSMAYDPESATANDGGTVLEAVTKDQLNTGLTGQIRFQVAERNLYAYLFGVKNPLAHVMGYFISVLRERIATFEAPTGPGVHGDSEEVDASTVAGVSINDLRKNLRDLNEHMLAECKVSEARYGIALDASLITGIDPPHRRRRRARRHQHRPQPRLVRDLPGPRHRRPDPGPVATRGGDRDTEGAGRGGAPRGPRPRARPAQGGGVRSAPGLPPLRPARPL